MKLGVREDKREKKCENKKKAERNYIQTTQEGDWEKKKSFHNEDNSS